MSGTKGSPPAPFPTEMAERIRSRLVGARWELEEALREERSMLSDGVLDGYLTGSLLDSEGAVQRLDALSNGAPCTPA